MFEGIGIHSSFLSDNLFWEENILLNSAMEIYGIIVWLQKGGKKRGTYVLKNQTNQPTEWEKFMLPNQINAC